MVVALPGPRGPSVPGLRLVSPADADMLADLMMSAYVGTVDYEGESRVQALEEVCETLSGKKGRFDWVASRVIARDDRLASAALLIAWKSEPFLCFSMTSANYKRHGLARACLCAAMTELADRGADRLRLLVARSNLPAVRLYERLGFRWEYDA